MTSIRASMYTLIMFIDSHCHLPSDESETDKILNRALNEGVTEVITVGTSIKNSKQAVKTANKFKQVYATVGVYPNSEKDMEIKDIIKKLSKIVTTEKLEKPYNTIVAIGEIGLDQTNWSNQRPINEQIQLFTAQIDLALQHNLPIVIHNRNSDKQILEILDQYKDTNLTGVAHCFDSNWETAKKFLDLNFYISFSGFVTFNRKKYLLETVTNIPTNKFLIETDSPYIVPKKVREQQNEPKNVKMIARKIADVKNLSLEEIAKHSYANTSKLFMKKGA